MRTGRRFTPALLEKWYDAGRGSGTGATYQPWHQVTRSDPGSRGRSHLINWRFGRLHHLLSDQELLAFGFASMWPGLLDLREQFPLEHDEHVVELAAYRADQITRLTPGTTEIANDLGLKHPVLRSGGVALPWVMSTDLLLTYAAANGRTELLAVSVKHDDELKVPRTRELLAIEREYWRRQDVYWLLISPSLYTRDVAASVLAGLPWWVRVIDGRGICVDQQRRSRMNTVVTTAATLQPEIYRDNVLIDAFGLPLSRTEIARRMLYLPPLPGDAMTAPAHTFAIQLAKHLGATVATTTSATNTALVKDLGADVVIDYKKEAFEDRLSGYDLVLNSQDGKTLSKSLGVLKPSDSLITITGPADPQFAQDTKAPWLVKQVIAALSFGVRRQAQRLKVNFSFLFMKPSGSQLNQITRLIESGAIRPVVDKVFPFSATNDAMAYVESGRAKGKVVIKVK